VTPELPLLTVTAAAVAVVHTALGPDHYLPFIALGRVRSWSLRRTLSVAAVCGVGHIGGSLALAVLALLVGRAGGLERFETARGALAGWLLLGFGTAYAAWGLRRALRHRPHSHWHTHVDGTPQGHSHGHRSEPAQLHAAHAHGTRAASRGGLTPWVLFIVFVLGPCEPLIPLLLVPAAAGDPWGAAVIGATFGLGTLATLLGLVAVGYLGLTRQIWANRSWARWSVTQSLGAKLSLEELERYSHAAAGLAVAACGLAIQLGL
jgi:hypothetical protein